MKNSLISYSKWNNVKKQKKKGYFIMQKNMLFDFPKKKYFLLMIIIRLLLYKKKIIIYWLSHSILLWKIHQLVILNHLKILNKLFSANSINLLVIHPWLTRDSPTIYATNSINLLATHPRFTYCTTYFNCTNIC